MRIALTGLAGSGKSTAANFLVERHRFIRHSYAAPIKRMVRCALIEAGAGFLEAVEMVDGHLKEMPTHFVCGKSPRQLMQTLGTEWGRNLIGRDIWRKILLRKVAAATSPVVVDDLRLGDEAEDLRNLGFLLIRIVRTGSGTRSAHATEGEEFDVDHVLENNGTPNDLFARMASFLPL
jgi:hypothetical protein